MKIDIIAPCKSGYRWKKRRSPFTFPPLALPILASLTPRDVCVRLIDEAVTEIDFNSNADAIALSVMTCTAPRAYEIATKFREKGKKIIMGGIHPSVMHEEALRYSDSVVMGEAESIWRKLINDLTIDKLQRVYYSQPDSLLKDLPVPRRDLLSLKAYGIPDTIYATRGCPFDCSFCSTTAFWGRHYRVRPVEEVVEEIKTFQGRFFLFLDDNLFAVPSYAKELCRQLIPLKKRWVTQCSINIVRDKELLHLASKAGCIAVLIGFESLSAANIKDIGKGVNQVEDYEDAIKKCEKNGILIQGSFIFGFDGDTLNTFSETLDFIMKVNLRAANFCPLTPLPGTRSYSALKEENRLLSEDWSKYDRGNVVFKPKNMTPEELKNGINWSYQKMYSFNSILRRIPWSWRHFGLYWIYNIAYRYGVKKG